MAENVTASPNFTRIESESGVATRDAINLLWRMLTTHKRSLVRNDELPEESDGWAAIAAVDQPTLLADEVQDTFTVVGVGITVELDPVTDTITLINDCCDDPCDTGYDIYYQDWSAGDSGGGIWGHTDHWGIPPAVTISPDTIDPLYPEILANENVKLTVGGFGPTGGNSIAPNLAIDPGVMGIRFQHTMWDASEGCMLCWCLPTSDTWDQIESFGGIYPIISLTREWNNGFGSGDFVNVFLNLFEDTDLTYPGGRYMQVAGTKFGGGAVGNISPGAALSNFNRVDTEDKWQRFEVEWKCGTVTRDGSGVVTSVAPDGYIAVYHTNVGGTGTRTLVCKVSDVQLYFPPDDTTSKGPAFAPNHVNGHWLGYFGYFGEAGPTGISSKACCFPDGYGTSGGGVTDCDSCVPGSDTEIIFNDGGSFGADAKLTFDKTLGKVHLITDGGRSGVILENDLGTGTAGHLTLNSVNNQYNEVVLGGYVEDDNDYITDDDFFAYFYCNTDFGAVGVDVPWGETPGGTATFNKGVGYDVIVPGAASHPNSFEVYQYGGLGTGAVPGMNLRVVNNDSGNGAAATLELVDKAGTSYFLWVEDGKLRIHTSRPTEDNTTVSHTAGTVVGTQS